ncbi:MAG: DUF169 domain-containing protein [Candidatus Omnitrophica bacterium]|nr:DUF169 domain-containing protein [Candidatus Omnitrophota bacterium]
MELEKWREGSKTLIEVLGMDTQPVGLACLEKPCPSEKPRERICRSILKAASGEKICLGAGNNACFGGAWHLGFVRLADPRTAQLVKKFVVEGEKLFSNYQALDNLISQMGEIPDNKNKTFYLAPLSEVDFRPEIILFLVNAEVACRLLTLIVFPDGQMPSIKIGGPTCRMAIIYPLISGQPNISFFDYTARKICGVPKDKLIVTLPAEHLPSLVKNVNLCSAGIAKVEFPQEFREFLQRRLVHSEKQTQ